MPSNLMSGWFQVGWSTDLAVGDVKQIHYFGEDLVAYRDADGAAHVLDAYCRHLGANLAVGGCVVDGGLQCPFHGWVWDADGVNVRIPDHDRPSRARLRSWPVVERFGVLMIWHDHEGRPPTFQPPETFGEVSQHLDALQFHEAGTGSQTLFPGTTILPQMVVENAVDPAHFRFVHHTPHTPKILAEHIDDWTWHSKVGFGGRWSDGVDRGDDHVNTLDLLWRGTGIAFNALTDPQRVMMVLIAVTPVDEHTTDVFGTYWPQVLPDDAETGRHLEYIADAKNSLPDDILIWDNQRFLENPALSTDEAAGFRKMREWTQKFYPEASGEPLAHLRSRPKVGAV
jgi:3-ketosteroid 9alpha-monooxygenase subunit A